MHSSLLIVAILTIGFGLASFFAYVMQRLHLPSILGYLLAGFLIGPHSPGYVANAEVATQLAEIGVILMLFGVGLHFKIEDLLRVRKIAIPGAIVQTLAATLFTIFLAYMLGWSTQIGLIIGLAIGVASTVVLVRILTDNNVLNTPKGHIAVGWLVVEDIFTVIILLLLPTIATASTMETFSFMAFAWPVLFILVKFCILALFMFTWGQKAIEYILTSVARLRSQESFTLAILALVFLIATGSAVVFGTSIALGAFIAGMVIGKTNVKHQAAANALPLKDIFAVIFFLSIGMLFNPLAIMTNLPLFLGLLGIILLIKPLSAYFITRTLGYSIDIGLTVGIALAQIGEFSFILAEEAMSLNLIPGEAFDILVACALISIALNPLFFQTIGALEKIIRKLSFFKGSKAESSKLVQKDDKFFSKVVVIGHGPIGMAVTKILKDAGYMPIIIEHNIDTVTSAERDNKIFFGDATEATILHDAHIEEASHLLITIPDATKAVKIIDAARRANPNIQIIARTQYIAERPLLDELKVQYICTEVEALKSYTALIRQTFEPIKSF